MTLSAAMDVRDGAVLDLVVRDVRDLVGASAPIDAELVSAAVRGWSHNTRRAFRSDLTIWGQWCRRNRLDPPSAKPHDVSRWVRSLAGLELSDETIRAMATIERYIVNVGWAYRMAGIADPTARSEEHTSELQSLMRISYAVFCLKKKNKHTNH